VASFWAKQRLMMTLQRQAMPRLGSPKRHPQAAAPVRRLAFRSEAEPPSH